MNILACRSAVAVALLTLALAGACSDDNAVSSNEQARRAYLGIDTSIQKSLQLGFDGFNSASSANIAPQMVAGTMAGTLTITGQVDQGSSANKGMRLKVGMVGYDDGPFAIDTNGGTDNVTYATDANVATQPALTLSLKGIPTGTLDGTLIGVYHLTGDIKGDCTLNLTFAGTLMDGGGGKVVRAAGSTTVTGTAVSGSGTYNVMLTI